MQIPKIIHQTWKTAEIPPEWQYFHSTWKTHNPDWQIVVWTDDDFVPFVRDNFPDFLQTFLAFSYNIQRVDAIRYLILFKYGGLYVDLDFECLRSIDALLENRTFVIGREPKIHAEWTDEKTLICNAFMASISGHLFLEAIIDELQSLNPKITNHKEVLETTGPAMVARVFGSYVEQDIHILEDHILYPLDSTNKVPFDLLQTGEETRELLIDKGAYAVHYWSNSWVRNLAGELKNPNPFNVSGYKFFPGKDSSGYDLENGGRDIVKLALACKRNRNAVGFNTDGFIKANIRPRKQWVDLKGCKNNEGLYIKCNYLSRLGRWGKDIVFKINKMR